MKLAADAVRIPEGQLDIKQHQRFYSSIPMTSSLTIRAYLPDTTVVSANNDNNKRTQSTS
jgi:hypothetical protein